MSRCIGSDKTGFRLRSLVVSKRREVEEEECACYKLRSITPSYRVAALPDLNVVDLAGWCLADCQVPGCGSIMLDPTAWIETALPNPRLLQHRAGPHGAAYWNLLPDVGAQ